jgi:hypothetical protein
MAYSKVKTIIVERDDVELEWKEEISPSNDLLQALGIITSDKIIISGGDLDPSVDGFPGIEGSVFFSTNNSIYKKIGINDTDWEIFSGGNNIPNGGLTGQVLRKLSDDDYDVDWVRCDVNGGYF